MIMLKQKSLFLLLYLYSGMFGAWNLSRFSNSHDINVAGCMRITRLPLPPSFPPAQWLPLCLQMAHLPLSAPIPRPTTSFKRMPPKEMYPFTLLTPMPLLPKRLQPQAKQDLNQAVHWLPLLQENRMAVVEVCLFLIVFPPPHRL